MKPKLLLLLLATFALGAAAHAQSRTPEGVADAFISAWNKHDMKAFARVFTKDAVWVPVAETMDKGRPAILKDFEEAHKTWAQATQLKRDAVTVHQVTKDVVTLFFHAHFVVDGKVVPEIDRAMIFVVKKSGGKWYLSAGQLTKQHDGA